MLGSPASAHVVSWYQQLVGGGPPFLLSQQEGTPPTYGLGVNPHFLAEMDPAKNAALLTVGNASPADEGTYYCALWFSGQYVFGEGTRLLYQGESKIVGIWCPSSDCKGVGGSGQKGADGGAHLEAALVSRDPWKGRKAQKPRAPRGKTQASGRWNQLGAFGDGHRHVRPRLLGLGGEA